jgi:ribosomal protein S18 acetylase RimI-like enzyme
MIELTVREMAAGDENGAAEVDRLSTADLRKTYRPTEMALRYRAAIDSDLRRLVAVANGRVVGVVQYSIARGRVLLMNLGVHPEYRRQGVARAIIDHLGRLAQNHRCSHLTLRTVRETGNVAVFERLGFAIDSEGRTTLFESDRYSALTEVVMSKRTNAGTNTRYSGKDSDTPPNPAMEPTAPRARSLIPDS